MMKIILLLFLFCLKSYSMDFIAESGQYCYAGIKGTGVILDEQQIQTINHLLSKSKLSPTPDYKKLGVKVKLRIPNRLFILNSKSSEEVEIRIDLYKKGKKTTITCLSILISKKTRMLIDFPDESRNKMDELILALEKELKRKTGRS